VAYGSQNWLSEYSTICSPSVRERFMMACRSRVFCSLRSSFYPCSYGSHGRVAGTLVRDDASLRYQLAAQLVAEADRGQRRYSRQVIDKARYAERSYGCDDGSSMQLLLAQEG
jgi:hypothetical protein